MHMYCLYAWLARVSVGLALVLSSCIAQKDMTAPPAKPVQPTTTPAVTSLLALRVGTTPLYPPISFKQEGRLTGLEVDFASSLETELGCRVEVVELDWEALDALHRDLETVLERWRRSGYLQELLHKWLRFHVE